MAETLASARKDSALKGILASFSDLEIDELD
jgi:hypothetical protein